MTRAGPPEQPVAPPACVIALAAGAPVTVVWRNELDGLTFALGDRFVKWSPAGSPIVLERERARLAWASAFARVPRVLDHGRDAEGEWLVTRALPGTSAVALRWIAAPAIAASAIGAGLRALHDALPVDDCPFSWSVADRLAVIHARAARPERWHADHRHLAVERALEILGEPPPIDRLVVCHGDSCAPNTLIDDAGRCSGHVDLGALGIADRWADLAIATWSTQWNYGPGWERALLDAYGIAPDAERTAYYRLLWDLGP
jgi:kanamycin kinase